MSVWPSRGYDIHGIEVKVSRYDWAKELNQPEKSAAVQQFCNRWWIATPEESIIKTGELPPTWGWMVSNGKGGMRVVTDAPSLTPKPISIEFLASVLRNVQRSDESSIERMVSKARQEGHDQGGTYHQRKYTELAATVAEFEKSSGIDLARTWDAGKVGEAVQVLRQLHHRTDQINSGIKACEDIRSMLEKVKDLATLKVVEV